MYVFIYVCIFVCMYTCIHKYVSMCVYIDQCMLHYVQILIKLGVGLLGTVALK